MQRIEDWLTSLGLSEHVHCFAENCIDASVLRDLTDHDLKDLGVPFGHRKKILRAIGELEGSRPQASPAALSAVPGERRQLTVMFCDLADFDRTIGASRSGRFARRDRRLSGGVRAGDIAL